MNYYAQTPPDEILSFSPRAENRAKGVTTELNAAALDVRYEVAFHIGQSVPEVQALFTQLEGRILRVWTVVPERDDAVYRKIYAHERDLVQTFDGMEFEFNIVPNLGRDPKMVITDPACRLVFQR